MIEKVHKNIKSITYITSKTSYVCRISNQITLSSAKRHNIDALFFHVSDEIQSANLVIFLRQLSCRV